MLTCIIVFWLFAKYNDASRHLLDVYDGWVKSDVTMPRQNYDMAVGHYANSIYLLGGYLYGFQLTQYDIDKNIMIFHGEFYLPFMLYGNGQFYSVSNNIMFLVDHLGTKLLTFDLTTLSFKNGSDFNIPYNVSTEACIVSTDAFVYIVGGRNNSDGVYLNTLQIFSKSTNMWLTDSMSMNAKRGALTCNVHPQNKLLYAIGGMSSKYDYVYTVEVIDTTSINEGIWKYIDSDLLYPVAYARSIIYGTSILVIGGMYREDTNNIYHIRGAIQIIDTTTGVISYGGSTIDGYVTHKHSAIIVNDMIYVFGGYGAGGVGLNIWEYFIIPTLSPTHLQTSSPTSSQTSAPTSLKTLSSTTIQTPTSDPSASPQVTSQTTQTPTNDPSIAPTNYIETTSCAPSLTIIKASGIETRTDLERTFHVFLYSIVSIVILISIIGYIDSKYIHQNDFYKVSLVFSAGLQISDMCSDCFFVININTHVADIDAVFNVYLIMTVVSILLIVLPVTISIAQLWYHLNNHWTNNNRTNVWIAAYSKYLYLLSFITGSSFTSISLLNCNFCTLSIFSMGLSKIEMKYFATKRLRSTIMIQ
eukprot:303319_1